MSVSSTISLALRRDRSVPYLPLLNSPGLDSNPSPRYHPAPSRNEIAVVQPVLVSPFRFTSNLKVFHEIYSSTGQATRGGPFRRSTIPFSKYINCYERGQH